MSESETPQAPPEPQSTETEQPEPTPKKAKMDVEVAEQAPDNEWPDAWLMNENIEDQKLPNKQDPNVPVDASALKEIGIR